MRTTTWGMLVAVAISSTVVLAGAGFSAAGVAEEEEITISSVMKEAMKGGLNKKVIEGEASTEEKDRLLALFQGLAANEPPEGDEESWKEKTKALVEGAEAAVKGEAEAPALLKGAASCKACHDAHRPS